MTVRIAIILLITLGSIPLTHCHMSSETSDMRLKWLPPAELPAETNGKPHPGLAGAISGILGRYYIVAGGANFPAALPWEGGKKQYHAEVYVYKQLPDGRLKYVGEQVTLPVPIAYPAIAQGNEQILVAGGETPEGFTNACFTLQYEHANSHLSIKALPSLPVPTANAASYLLGKEWLVAGGETRDGTTEKVWKLNIENPAEGWQPAPSLPQALAFATLAGFQNKKGANEWRLAGGRCRVPGAISKIYGDVYLLSEGDGTWQKSEPLPYAMSAMCSTVLPGGRWIIFSGDKGETFSKVEQLLLSISMASNDIERKQLEATKASLQKSHPGFNDAVLVWHPETKKWKETDSMPLPPPVTTYAVYSRGNIYLGSGEIRAGIRSPHIMHAQVQE